MLIGCMGITVRLFGTRCAELLVTSVADEFVVGVLCAVVTSRTWWMGNLAYTQAQHIWTSTLVFIFWCRALSHRNLLCLWLSFSLVLVATYTLVFYNVRCVVYKKNWCTSMAVDDYTGPAVTVICLGTWSRIFILLWCSSSGRCHIESIQFYHSF